jgi:hypothetical protein
MQSWAEHAENHERIKRLRLDDIALRSAAAPKIYQPAGLPIFHRTFIIAVYFLAAEIGALLALLSMWRHA